MAWPRRAAEWAGWGGGVHRRTCGPRSSRREPRPSRAHVPRPGPQRTARRPRAGDTHNGWCRSVCSLRQYFCRNFSARSAASTEPGWLATARFTTCEHGAVSMGTRCRRAVSRVATGPPELPPCQGDGWLGGPSLQAAGVWGRAGPLPLRTPGARGAVGGTRAPGGPRRARVTTLWSPEPDRSCPLTPARTV